jgi:hypothetical protein
MHPPSFSVLDTELLSSRLAGLEVHEAADRRIHFRRLIVLLLLLASFAMFFIAVIQWLHI